MQQNGMKEKEELYENVISLGWFCGMASVMRWLGLRSFSGPFDWIYSDLPSVLNNIDNQFSDFVVKNHMQVDKKHQKRFTDSKYGFYFMHDIKTNFDSDWKDIESKYQRRIARFNQAIKSKTLFLRAVRNIDELKYIERNTEYIDSVIKKYNNENKIVYILINGMGFSAEFQGEYLNLGIDEYYFRKFIHTFIADDMLCSYCSALIDTNKQRDNANMLPILLNAREIAAAFIYLSESKPSFIIQIMKEMIDLKDGLYIWGAGEYATILIEVLLKNNVVINGIMDSDMALVGKKILGVSVIAYDQMDNIPVFIAVADDSAVKEISNILKSNNQLVDIFSFNDFRNEVIRSVVG